MRLFFVSAVIVALLVGSPPTAWGDDRAAASGKDKPQQTLIRISKETTVLTEPLDDEGFVDYLEAINVRLSKGVTPENNFEVVARRVLGKDTIDESIRAEYFRRLGIDPPASDTNTFQSFEAFLDTRIKPEPITPDEQRKREQILAHYRKAGSQPWSKRDNPLLFEWLTQYANQLDAAVEGSKRPRCYTPYIAPDTRKEPTWTGTKAFVEVARLDFSGLTRFLIRRAMHRLQAGNSSGAWSDIQAVHRIARHAANGALTLEIIAGAGIELMASHADRDVLQFGKLNAK